MTKIPPKNSKLPPLFLPQKIQNPPKKYKNGPTVLPLKKYKNTPQRIQKRPQTSQKDLKNENKGQIVIFGGLFVIL
jgi:hypothetical protein